MLHGFGQRACRDSCILNATGDFVRRVALLSDGFDRAGNVLDFGDRFRNLVDCNDGIIGRFLNFRHLEMDILGRASRLIGQVLHFRGDQQKPLAALPARAKERQEGMVEFVFKSLCGTCHQETKLEDGGDLKWTVEPVGLNERWFRKAKFDHGSHRIVDCSDCHNAKSSTKSSDILILGMAVCLKCYGPADEFNRVSTTCVTCHEFHVENLPSMAESANSD